jgi:acyl-CoA synthetase (AMP-forming)/AMP-acid ligase II
MTPIGVLCQLIETRSKQVAFIKDKEVWTYKRLAAEVERLAQGLAERGLRKGDRVALHMANLPEFVVAYHACFRAGLIAAPLNIRFKTAELRPLLQRLRPSLYTGRLADYKVPESLQIADEIPRNATGKVDRQSLSKMRTDCSNLSPKKYRRINRHRRPILVPYKFVGLVSSPRWILRPGAEEAIRTTIAAIGTANGRSPKNYSRLKLRQRDKNSLAA